MSPDPRLSELLGKWRLKADDVLAFWHGVHPRDTLRQCANELAAVLLGGTPQLQEEEMQEDTRVAPLTAGADVQELPRRSQPGAVTAAERTDLTIEVERDGRQFFASWETGDGKEVGCAEYSPTIVGALANLCATLIKVDEDKAVERAASGGIASSPRPELTFHELAVANLSRVKRWHPKGLDDWSPLEWAGAMAGEAGEACNAAKKLKRIDIGTANINNEPGRSLTDRKRACRQIAEEVADAVVYGVLVCAAVGEDLSAAVIDVFNRKSEEYGFPERIGPAAPVRPVQEKE